MVAPSIIMATELLRRGNSDSLTSISETLFSKWGLFQDISYNSISSFNLINYKNYLIIKNTVGLL